MWLFILRSQDEMRWAEEQSGAKMHCHAEKWWEADKVQLLSWSDNFLVNTRLFTHHVCRLVPSR